MTSRIQYNNPKNAAAFGLPYHYEMVSDASRITPFREAIFATCTGKVVLESGTGSGILSILAARAGAKKVYAVEIDPVVAKFARQNIQQSGYQDIITLIERDIREVQLKDLGDQKVDVVIAENLSTWQVTEPQISILNHINQHLIKENGIRFPEKIFNSLELAQTQYRFEDLIDLKTYFFEFSGVKKSRLLSAKAVINSIELSQQNPAQLQLKSRLVVQNEGLMNSVRLTSPLQVYQGIHFESSDSLMPPVIFPLDQEIQVYKNDVIEVNIRYDHESSWESFYCVAKKS